MLKKVGALEKELSSIEVDMSKITKREHEILSMDNKEHNVMNENKYQGIEKDAYDVLVREKEKLIDRKNQDDILKKKIKLWVA